MPPKGWTSGRPEGLVKAVRLTEATIERIARHVERLQAQLPFVRVNEGMAIRNLIDIGLGTVETGEQIQQTTTPDRPAPLVNRPKPMGNRPQALENPNTPVHPNQTLPMAAVGMKWCAKGLHQYPIQREECPNCARLRKRNQRARARAQAH
jgi:hypothetical protein